MNLSGRPHRGRQTQFPQQDENESERHRPMERVFLDFFFPAEKRNDKQKQDHHRSCINNDLDHCQKFRIIKEEQKGQTNHMANQVQGAVDRRGT